MRYVLLIVGIGTFAWGFWIFNGRADEMAQIQIQNCEAMYKITERNSQKYQVDNSENIYESGLCQGRAYGNAKELEDKAVWAMVAGGFLAGMALLMIRTQQPQNNKLNK